MKREDLQPVLPLSSAAVRMIDSWMPECYRGGDDYPRSGCTVALQICEDAVIFQFYAPNGKLMAGGLKAPRDEAGRYLDEWLRGISPRRQPATNLPDQR